MEGLTEAVPKLGGNPLSDSYLKAVAKEIEQTAVAVSVVGAAPWKLKQLAALAEPVAGALEGERPEVAKVRSALKRLAHNVKTSNPAGQKASAALRALAQGLSDVRKLVGKGLGKADRGFKVAGFEVMNTWGYTGSEVRDVTRALEAVSKALLGVGLPTAAGGLVELNPANVKDSVFVQYDPQADLFVVDAGKSGSANVESMLRALAERLWLQEFSREDKDTWGNGKGREGFSRAFVGQLSGQRPDSDAAARLQVTVGKLAARWPQPKSVQASRGSSPLDRLLQEIKFKIGTKRTRKSGKWQKVEDPNVWKRVKGTFAQDAMPEADALAKKNKSMARAIKRIGRYAKEGKIVQVTAGEHLRVAKVVQERHAKRFAGFKKDLKRIVGDYEVMGRVKDVASMIGKIAPEDAHRIKYKTAADLGDVTGARIVTDSVWETYDVIDRLKKQGMRHGIKVLEVDDKIRNPQGDAKYRSIHLELVDKDGLKKELQVRTRRQNIVSDWSHDVYKPFSEGQMRALEKHSGEIVDYAARASDYFYAQDRGEKADKPDCPKVVSLHFGCLT